MIRTTLDSIVKLPLQIPSETSVRSKKETEAKVVSINKSAPKKEAIEVIHDSTDLAPVETTPYSNGYIKYPRYDFF